MGYIKNNFETIITNCDSRKNYKINLNYDFKDISKTFKTIIIKRWFFTL